VWHPASQTDGHLSTAKTALTHGVTQVKYELASFNLAHPHPVYGTISKQIKIYHIKSRMCADYEKFTNRSFVTQYRRSTTAYQLLVHNNHDWCSQSANCHLGMNTSVQRAQQFKLLDAQSSNRVHANVHYHLVKQRVHIENPRWFSRTFHDLSWCFSTTFHDLVWRE